MCVPHHGSPGMSPTEPVQSMRSTMGDYSVDVLDAAVAKAGDKLLNITSTIRNFIQVHGSGHNVISSLQYCMTVLLQLSRTQLCCS